MNDPKNLGTDVFGFRLLYNNQDANLGNVPKFNGNISGMTWRAGMNSSTLQGVQPIAYRYAYDDLSRLTSAVTAT